MNVEGLRAERDKQREKAHVGAHVRDELRTERVRLKRRLLSPVGQTEAATITAQIEELDTQISRSVRPPGLGEAQARLTAARRAVKHAALRESTASISEWAKTATDEELEAEHHRTAAEFKRVSEALGAALQTITAERGVRARAAERRRLLDSLSAEDRAALLEELRKSLEAD